MQRQISDYAAFLDRIVRPTHYQVVQLKQRNGDTIIGRSPGIDDAQTVYRDVSWRYIDRLSRSIYGNRGYRNRRHRPLPHLITLEGDGVAVRYHLNVLLRQPDWISTAEFANRCEQVWWKSPWAYLGANSFYFDERTGDCPAYSLKDHLNKNGTDCILSYAPAEDS